MTVTGTISGLVVTEKADSVLLMVLAIVAPVFGLLWLDHARNIGEIGDFIRRNWPWAPNWEQRNAERKNSGAGRFRFVIFILAVTIVFVGPALGGLWASVDHLDGTRSHAAWGGAVTLTALFVVSWTIQVAQSWSPSSGQSVT